MGTWLPAAAASGVVSLVVLILGGLGRRAFGSVFDRIDNLKAEVGERIDEMKEVVQRLSEQNGGHSVKIGVHEHRLDEVERRLAKVEEP